MKKYTAIIALAALVGITAACNKDSEQTTWDKYTEWRELNEAWLAEMQARTEADGTPYYQTIRPDWNPGAFVLMHYFNDPAENADKLSPLYTSTIDVRYKLHLCDGTPVDSSDLITGYGAPGVYRARLNQLVQGWAIGLTQTHCGDSVELIVPYGVGYGSTSTGSVLPYSNLRFNIRLVDIPYYEAPPYQ
ncbi:MAG: FKBP-type peptidyl-prolyl cis-trans isomerase [Muribaculaceae bacterium]|nr:FKBP-type peptidyl-prolyl cis-trans isomerase [Muribaculaceae bacterium]